MSPSDALSSSSNPDGGLDRERLRDSIKRRSSRACDQCRKTKGRCDRKSIDDICGSCRLGNLHCTTSGPNLKRGPPKGYLRAVETHLHETEAVLGILLAVPDLRLRAILQSVAEDPFAQTVLNRVNNCPFGPANRPTPADHQRNRTTLESPYGENTKDGASSNPFTVGPTNSWQDYVVAKITASLGGPIPPEARIPLDFSSTDERLTQQALSRGDALDHIYPMPETVSDGIESPTESPADYNFDDLHPGMGHTGDSSSGHSPYHFGSLHPTTYRGHFSGGHDDFSSRHGHSPTDTYSGLDLRHSSSHLMSPQSHHQHLRRPDPHVTPGQSGSGSSGSGRGGGDGGGGSGGNAGGGGGGGSSSSWHGSQSWNMPS